MPKHGHYVFFYGGLYMNIPLTDIHASGPAILILYYRQIINCAGGC